MRLAANSNLLLSLLAALFVDQALKGVVLVGLRGSNVIALGSVRIRPIRSDRIIAARLGIRPVLLWCAWIACLLTILLVPPLVGLFQTPLSQAALGVVLGGALGNLLDVNFRKGVVDYVELGAWPAFNLADVAIVTGVILVLLAN